MSVSEFPGESDSPNDQRLREDVLHSPQRGIPVRRHKHTPSYIPPIYQHGRATSLEMPPDESLYPVLNPPHPQVNEHHTSGYSKNTLLTRFHDRNKSASDFYFLQSPRQPAGIEQFEDNLPYNSNLDMPIPRPSTGDAQITTTSSLSGNTLPYPLFGVARGEDNGMNGSLSRSHHKHHNRERSISKSISTSSRHRNRSQNIMELLNGVPLPAGHVGMGIGGEHFAPSSSSFATTKIDETTDNAANQSSSFGSHPSSRHSSLRPSSAQQPVLHTQHGQMNEHTIGTPGPLIWSSDAPESQINGPLTKKSTESRRSKSKLKKRKTSSSNILVSSNPMDYAKEKAIMGLGLGFSPTRDECDDQNLHRQQRSPVPHPRSIRSMETPRGGLPSIPSAHLPSAQMPSAQHAHIFTPEMTGGSMSEFRGPPANPSSSRLPCGYNSRQRYGNQQYAYPLPPPEIPEFPSYGLPPRNTVSPLLFEQTARQAWDQGSFPGSPPVYIPYAQVVQQQQEQNEHEQHCQEHDQERIQQKPLIFQTQIKPRHVLRPRSNEYEPGIPDTRNWQQHQYDQQWPSEFPVSPVVGYHRPASYPQAGLGNSAQPQPQPLPPHTAVDPSMSSKYRGPPAPQLPMSSLLDESQYPISSIGHQQGGSHALSMVGHHPSLGNPTLRHQPSMWPSSSYNEENNFSQPGRNPGFPGPNNMFQAPLPPYHSSHLSYDNDNELVDMESSAEDNSMDVPGPSYSEEAMTHEWTEESVQELMNLLESAERHKWKYVSDVLSQRLNKRIPLRACKNKFEAMFGETENSSLLRSSLFYVAYRSGWDSIRSELTESERAENSHGDEHSRQSGHEEDSKTSATETGTGHHGSSVDKDITGDNDVPRDKDVPQDKDASQDKDVASDDNSSRHPGTNVAGNQQVSENALGQLATEEMGIPVETE